MAFVDVPFDTDPDDLSDAAIDGLRAAIPGWEPADGNLEVWLIAALARIVAEATAVAASVPAAVFRQFGLSLIGLPPLNGVYATMATTWTARDTLGHTIPAGTQVGYRVSGDSLIAFVVGSDVLIPPGSASLGGVVLTASTVGVAANAVPVGPLELIDSLSWVDTVAATAISAGGVDAETDDAYLARLAAELRLLSPRPIVPGDFSVLAQSVTGVTRALTVDGYNPVGPSSGNARMVCVFPIDAAGAACSSPIRTAVQTYLDGLREVTFAVNVSTPTSTTINVTYSVHVLTGFDTATVKAACDAAVTAHLSPATWGGGDESPPVWVVASTVRFLRVTAVLSNVPGVDYVAALTLNTGTSDITLSGVAPLPVLGTLVGTLV